MQTKLILAGVILGIILLCGWYYKWSQAEIKVLGENVVKLNQAKELQDKTIKSMRADSLLSSSTLIEVDEKYQAARKTNTALRKVLAKHNIAYLASKKPRLVQKIINRGSVNAARCLELLSGAKHTEKELKATKRSQINKSCPAVANPNFKAKK